MKNTKEEFCKAVNEGREIEFRYNGKHYFESRNGNDKLLLHTILEGKNINDIWEDIIIDYIL